MFVWPLRPQPEPRWHSLSTWCYTCQHSHASRGKIKKEEKMAPGGWHEAEAQQMDGFYRKKGEKKQIKMKRKKPSMKRKEKTLSAGGRELGNPDAR